MNAQFRGLCAVRPAQFYFTYMIILIDYDNLPKPMLRTRLCDVVETILSKIEFEPEAFIENVSCRLYGGWLKWRSLSQRAQDLSRQIHGDFPFPFRVSNEVRVIAKAELATSLACDPLNIFPNTFRMWAQPAPFYVKRFPVSECAAPNNCPISVVNPFVYNKICTYAGCDVSPETVFYRAEQKLVDSMIVVDLVHFATYQEEHLVLVSGDDDMWPGIRYALLKEALITHIIPKLSRKRKNPYKQLSTKNYTAVTL